MGKEDQHTALGETKSKAGDLTSAIGDLTLVIGIKLTHIFNPIPNG
jgi:hypothetical protein